MLSLALRSIERIYEALLWRPPAGFWFARGPDGTERLETRLAGLRPADQRRWADRQRLSATSEDAAAVSAVREFLDAVSGGEPWQWDSLRRALEKSGSVPSDTKRRSRRKSAKRQPVSQKLESALDPLEDMAGLQIPEFTITVDGEYLTLEVRDFRKQVHFAETGVGFKDKRSIRPNRDWKMLQEFALVNGEYVLDERSPQALRNRVSSLRRELNAMTRTDGNPIVHVRHKGVAIYRTAFQLRAK